MIKKCDTSLPNNGDVCCNDNTFGVVTSLFFTKPDFYFSSVVNFSDEDKWNEAIADGDLIPVIDVQEVEDQSEENEYYDSPTGTRISIKSGKYRHLYKVKLSFEQHKLLFGISNKDLLLFKGDINNNVSGYLNGSNIQGFSLDMVNVEKMAQGAPDRPAWTVISIQESDAKEWNENGIFNAMSFDVNGMMGIVPVVLEYVSYIGANLYVSVYAECGYNEDGSVNQIPLSGLSVDSFTVTGNDATSVTDNGNGLFLLDGDIDWSTGDTIQITPIESSLYQSNLITLT